MNVKPYMKFIVAIGTAIGVAVAGVGDGVFDVNDGVQTVLALLGALGVYQVRNKMS